MAGPFSVGFSIDFGGGVIVTMAESASGSTYPIIDHNGTRWTIKSGQVAMNGQIDSRTQDVIGLAYYSHVIYYRTATYWRKRANGSWIATPDPTPVAPGPLHLGPTIR